MRSLTSVLLFLLVAHRPTIAWLGLEEKLPRWLSNNIIYRKYQAGDDSSRVLEDLAILCTREDVFCFVAVDTSISAKAVVGYIEMEIPAYMPDPRVMDAILEKMPAPSKKKKDKVIGYIAYVKVAASSRGQGIGTDLISRTFNYLGRTRPNLVAMYLMVNEDDKAAIALYKKTQFVMLTYQDKDTLYYARYNMK